MTGPAEWRLLRDRPRAPALNMALDELLLAGEGPGAAAAARPVLRLYAWDPPALSLGWFQPAEAFDAAALAAAGVTVVRRPTGGGAIHHDHELTFAVTAMPGQHGYPAETQAAYAWVHGVLIGALARCGVRAAFRGGDWPLSIRPRDGSLCFRDHTALDLVDEQGRKLVGSAQRRRGGRVLHHGSVPLTAPALTPDCGSVSAAAGRAVSWEELADAVEEAFGEALADVPARLVPDRFRADELARAELARAELVRARQRGESL